MSNAAQRVAGIVAAEDSRVSPADLVGLPKAHLHMHFAGSVPRPYLAAMEAENGKHIAFPDRYASLPDFLSAYSEVVSLIRASGDLSAIAHAIAWQEHRQGVVYFEPSLSPRTFSDGHRSPEDVLATAIEGFTRAEEECGIGFGVMISGYWHSDAETLVADVRDLGHIAAAISLAT